MKTKNNGVFERTKHRRSFLIAVMAISACMFSIAACQRTTINNDDNWHTPGPPVPVSSYYIHGRLLNSDSTIISKARIMVCDSSAAKRCNSTTGYIYPKEIMSDTAGMYHFVIGEALPKHNAILKTFNVRVMLQGENSYITPEPHKLNLDFKLNTPHDSLLIDFVVPDSTKRAANDNTSRKESKKGNSFTS